MGGLSWLCKCLRVTKASRLVRLASNGPPAGFSNKFWAVLGDGSSGRGSTTFEHAPMRPPQGWSGREPPGSVLSPNIEMPSPGTWLSNTGMVRIITGRGSGYLAVQVRSFGAAADKVGKHYKKKKPTTPRQALKYARQEKQRLRLRREVAIKSVWKTRDYVTLVRNILKEQGWGAKTIEDLEPLAIALNTRRMQMILEHQKDPRVALKFFWWAGQQEGCKPTLNLYQYIIKMLLSKKRYQDVWELLERKQQEAEKLTKLVYAPILRSYERVEDALETYEKLKDIGYFPDIVAYNFLLQMLVKAKDYHNTRRVFKEMVEEGCAIDAKAYTTMMQALEGQNDSVGVFDTYQELRKSACTPYLPAYNMQIAASIKLDRPKEAFKVVQEMRKRDLFPSVSSCTALIGHLKRSGEMDEAFKLFEEMKVQRLVRDMDLYCTIITGFCDLGRTEEALHLFEGMKAIGCKPGVTMYTTLIDRFTKADASHVAFRLLSEMRERALDAGEVTLRNLINGLARAGLVVEVFATLQQMQKANFRPEVCTFNFIIGSVGKKAFAQEALKFLKEVKSGRGFLLVDICNLMLEALIWSGAGDEATLVFQEMQELGCDPNEVTLRLLKDANRAVDTSGVAGNSVEVTEAKDIALP